MTWKKTKNQKVIFTAVTQMTAIKTRCLSQAKNAAVENTSECQCSWQVQLCDEEDSSKTALKADWDKKEKGWFIKKYKKKLLQILV